MPQWHELKKITEAERRAMRKAREKELAQARELAARNERRNTIILGTIIVLLLISVGVAIYLIYSSRTERIMKTKNEKVFLKNVKGQVLYKPKGEGVFIKKGTLELEKLDQIKTEKDSAITVIFEEGRTMRLGAESEFEVLNIEAVGENFEGRNVECSLHRGKGYFDIRSSFTSLTVIAPFVRVEVKPRTGSVFKIEIFEKKGEEQARTRICVNTGNIAVTATGPARGYEVKNAEYMIIYEDGKVEGPGPLRVLNEQWTE